MRAAAANGAPMEPAALAYQVALAGSIGPIAGVSVGQPLLLRLSLLPGAAQDFLVIRSALAVFCAAEMA
jgi:hypothetical protein